MIKFILKRFIKSFFKKLKKLNITLSSSIKKKIINIILSTTNSITVNNEINPIYLSNEKIEEIISIINNNDLLNKKTYEEIEGFLENEPVLNIDEIQSLLENIEAANFKNIEKSLSKIDYIPSEEEINEYISSIPSQKEINDYISSLNEIDIDELIKILESDDLFSIKKTDKILKKLNK